MVPSVPLWHFISSVALSSKQPSNKSWIWCFLFWWVKEALFIIGTYRTARVSVCSKSLQTGSFGFDAAVFSAECRAFRVTTQHVLGCCRWKHKHWRWLSPAAAAGSSCEFKLHVYLIWCHMLSIYKIPSTSRCSAALFSSGLLKGGIVYWLAMLEWFVLTGNVWFIYMWVTDWSSWNYHRDKWKCLHIHGWDKTSL